MTADPSHVQNYDLAKGLEFVALWLLIIFVGVLFFSIRAQYRLMNLYDASLGSAKKKRIQIILDQIKLIILSVLGYKGERRERVSLANIHAGWVFENFGSIFFRFSIFYFVYIWGLILTTRPLLINANTGQVQIMNYTSKPIFGFLMIFIYIFSNAIFDILSIYFTIKHLDRIKNDPGISIAVLLLLKNISYSFVFFCLSQLISNLIWPLKTNFEVSLLERLISPAIVFWPYAFVLDTNSSSPEYFRLLFPGQLLITGTVFLPTLVVALLSIVLMIAISLIGALKKQLVSSDLVGILVTPGPGKKPAVQFRCINALTVSFISSLFASFVYEWIKILISRV
jgi:hypothetical protein